MKTSNLVLLILLLSVLLSTAATAFYIRSFLEPPIRDSDPGVSETNGRWVRDTLSATYHYIWTNYPEVQLNPKSENFVETILHESATGKVKVEVRNDTLYILQNPANDYEHYSYINLAIRELNTQVVVGVKQNIKGLTAVDRGRITPFEGYQAPYDIGLDWEVGFPDESMSGVPVVCDNLTIDLQRGGDAVVNLDAEKVYINLSGPRHWHSYTRLRLLGNSRFVQLDHTESMVDVKLQGDSLFLDTHTPFSQKSSIIRVWPKKYLSASIEGWSDVIYLGHPLIRKKESGFGRLIDGNYYP